MEYLGEVQEGGYLKESNRNEIGDVVHVLEIQLRIIIII